MFVLFMDFLKFKDRFIKFILGVGILIVRFVILGFKCGKISEMVLFMLVFVGIRFKLVVLAWWMFLCLVFKRF